MSIAMQHATLTLYDTLRSAHHKGCANWLQVIGLTVVRHKQPPDEQSQVLYISNIPVGYLG
jgi:hypothetical protein